MFSDLGLRKYMSRCSTPFVDWNIAKNINNIGVLFLSQILRLIIDTSWALF